MSELNDPFADQLSPTEREMLGLSQTVTYSYRCSLGRNSHLGEITFGEQPVIVGESKQDQPAR
jgi:hypothetical protein